MTTPVPGECVLIGAAASVQFAGDRALVFRVVSVSDTPTYHGWAWITGYVLDDRGMAREKREVYVNLAGLRPAQVPQPQRNGAAVPRARQAAPATQPERRNVPGVPRSRRPVAEPAAGRPGSVDDRSVPAAGRPGPTAVIPGRTLVPTGHR